MKFSIPALFLIIFFSFPKEVLAAHTLKNNAIENPSVLILYDATMPIGSRLPHLFLANLLGHFKKQYSLLAVKDFSTEQAQNYETIFYLGTNYYEPPPEEFLKFVLTTRKTVVWFKYHLWEFKGQHSDFEKRYGFYFSGLDHTEFEQIRYKNTLLTRNKFDQEMSIVQITTPDLVEIKAYAENKAGLKIPYAVHRDNFWYFADIPFVYISENDRYLVFADLLYDILNVEIKPKKRALIRLEDIHPHYDPTLLRQFADYLHKEKIPFAISIIPYYKDPKAYYPGLVQDYPITQAPLFVETIKDMSNKGGTLILHGYTHQYETIQNPYLGVSGADFEFMQVQIDPHTFKITHMDDIPQDSTEWIKNRIELAENLLHAVGLDTSIWETPHYAASALDNQFFGAHFKAISGRVEYFESGQHSNQFFPYPIEQDVYGQKIIPENLGCYSPVSWYSHPKRDLNDLIETAEKNLVVRDAWASFYYHPYLGLEALKTLIQNIRALGYEFVSVQTV